MATTNSYPVRFSDNRKSSLTVEDGTVNNLTSLDFPGRNVTGYGQIVAEDLLHLLENFANIEAPRTPIQGQLWYDNNEGVNQLKIYDGTNWSPAGGLKRSNREPSSDTSIPGDLWVNTDTQQLYLFSGSGWILVGPRFSSGAKSGTEAEVVIDVNDISQTVVSHYVSGERIAIISSVEFVPKSTIIGFPLIRKGVTLPNVTATTAEPTSTLQYKYYGTAEKAESLVSGTTIIPAENFLRSDTSNNPRFAFNVRNSSGVSVGEDAQLSLQVDGTTGVLYHKTPGSSLDFRVYGSIAPQTVIRIDSSKKVGINNLAPQADLDVTGNILASGTIKTTSVLDAATPTTGSIVTAGGIGVGKTLRVGVEVHAPTVYVSSRVEPDADLSANLGSASNRFRQTYTEELRATDIYGTLFGTVSGNVTGRASRLASPTTFKIAGDITSTNDIEFDGSNASVNTLATISASGTGTIATLYFEEQPTVPFPTGTDILIEFIVPVGYRGANGSVVRHTVIEGTRTYVKYASTATGNQTVAGIISNVVDEGNVRTFNTVLNNDFVFNKEATSVLNENDEFLISTIKGLKKISKADMWQAVPRMPIGSIVPYAGPTAPAGWLFCDGSEVNVFDYYGLFKVVGYTYGDSATLLGNSTFKVPDLRGRFALGLDNMNNNIKVPSKANAAVLVQSGGGPANRVTDVKADTLGLSSGAETLTVNQAVTPSNKPTITSTNTNQVLNVMNPYLSINYIIYTGSDL